MEKAVLWLESLADINFYVCFLAALHILMTQALCFYIRIFIFFNY